LQKQHQKPRPPTSPRSALKTSSKRPNVKKLLRKAHVKPLKPLKQVAALPFRVDAEGRIEILLITSRDTGRWIIPKGWPMSGRKAHQAAEREAFEEAGLKGQIAASPVGRYHYQKRFDHGRAFPCMVRVYPLRVEAQHARWPEQDQRTLRWFPPEEAARLVHEDELQELLADFAVRPVESHG
jgi:8-oxo-dGTP pyrophosphatase MutT (NUDIX family)